MNMASVVKISKAKAKGALDPVKVACTILKEAASWIKTSDMLCNCMEFLLELINSKEFGTKRKQAILVRCYEMLEDKLDSYNIQSSDVVHWRA